MKTELSFFVCNHDNRLWPSKLAIHLCRLLSLAGRQSERSRSKVTVIDMDTCLPPKAAGSLKERPSRCFTMASPCSGEWVAMATRSRISWLEDCNLCVGECVKCEGVCVCE